MSWDYADLSSMAKDAGGPDALVNSIESKARDDGKVEGTILGVAAAAGVYFGGKIVCFGVKKIYNWRVNRKKRIADAKAELVAGIKDYDAQNADAAADPSFPDDNEEVSSDASQNEI